MRFFLGARVGSELPGLELFQKHGAFSFELDVNFLVRLI